MTPPQNSDKSAGESYCDPACGHPHPCFPFEPFTKECPIVEQSKYHRKKRPQPCYTKELIPEVRPDTQMNVMVLSKVLDDPCDPLGAVRIGRMVDSIKLFNERQSTKDANLNL